MLPDAVRRTPLPSEPAGRRARTLWTEGNCDQWRLQQVRSTKSLPQSFRLPLLPRRPQDAAVIGSSGHRRLGWRLSWPSSGSYGELIRNAVTYETAPLGRGTVQSGVKATGTANAVVDVQVGSQVSGNIKALYADFNTKVIKGQLVARNRKGK